MVTLWKATRSAAGVFDLPILSFSAGWMTLACANGGAEQLGRGAPLYVAAGMDFATDVPLTGEEHFSSERGSGRALEREVSPLRDRPAGPILSYWLFFMVRNFLVFLRKS